MNATVVVLTFNAGAWIDRLLAALARQQTEFSWETLIIDSGSGDGTLPAVRQYVDSAEGRARLHQIPNNEFGHGKTRNMAASMAKGEYVVFLTHDAVPAHEHWLEAMIQPFAVSDRVACVYGKQIPWPDCPPSVKRDVTGLFRRHGPDHCITLQERNALITHQAEIDATTFFSDVNSAIRKSVLTGPIPFRDLSYAEDQAFGRDVIAAGYLKAYTPFGAVLHSHHYALLQYYRRMYDEMVGLKNATGRSLDTSIAFHLAWMGKSTLDDWRFIARDSSYAPSAKAKWFVEAPFYNAARRVAIRLSVKDNLPRWVRNVSSLEFNQRRRL